eukprot:1219450-Amorphochlora_amoeboformis.AAC.1
MKMRATESDSRGSMATYLLQDNRQFSLEPGRRTQWRAYVDSRRQSRGAVGNGHPRVRETSLNSQESEWVHAFRLALRFRDAKSLSIALDKCGRVGNWDSIERLWGMVEEYEDVVAYNAAMNAYANSGIPEKSINLFVDMVSSKVKPETSRRIWQSMVDEEVSRDQITYAHAFQASVPKVVA